MTNGNIWFRNQMTPYLNGLTPYLNIVTPAVNLAAFPAIGETTKIYIAEDTTKLYRWTGATYAEVSTSGATPSASTTVEGIVELATLTETNAGSLTNRAVTPSGLSSILAAIALNTAKLTNVDTDLTYTASPTNGTVNSSDGTNAIITLADATNAGLLTPSDFTKLGTITSDADVNLTKVQLEALLLKGLANGLASLDASGLVPAAQLPGYVDDVVIAANLTALDALVFEASKVYVAQDTNITYRWNGIGQVAAADLVIIGTDLALGITASTAYRGDLGNTAYQHSQIAHAPADADNTATNETSHADVLIDGDFTSNGIMTRTAAGVYAIDSSSYITAAFVTNGLEDPLVDVTDVEALADINTALGI